MAEFFIGTSGYSYKDWEGEFYPGNISASQYLGFYLRFHGRNARKWWNSREAFERYNYMYKREELEEWILKNQGSFSKIKKDTDLFQ